MCLILSRRSWVVLQQSARTVMYLLCISTIISTFYRSMIFASRILRPVFTPFDVTSGARKRRECTSSLSVHNHLSLSLRGKHYPLRHHRWKSTVYLLCVLRVTQVIAFVFPTPYRSSSKLTVYIIWVAMRTNSDISHITTASKRSHFQ